MDLQEILDCLAFIGRNEGSLLANDDLLVSQAQRKAVEEFGESLGIRVFTSAESKDLTTAGRVFAREVTPIKDELDELVEKCRRIQQGDADSLVLQDLPFPLLFDKKIGGALYSYAQNGLLVDIVLRSTDGMKTIAAIKAHRIDIGFYADPGDEAQVMADLEAIGIGALPLRREQFVLRANPNHPLMTKDRLYPIDLVDYPVAVSKAESLDMLRELLMKAYEKIGMVPSLVAKNTNSYTEFYLMPLTDEVQITDESTERALGGSQDHVAFRHFDDEDFGFTRYLIYDNTVVNHIVSMFLDIVAREEDE
ncbi:MAG: hypothetical protein HFJ75_01010 [Eggerthellaceae bacterium]|nr:hypothetical protein [Eggerthellaceae bacterium]